MNFRHRFFSVTSFGLGGAFVLALVAALVLWLAISGRHREQRVVAQVMAAQGETLIRAMEAGGRVGLRGPGAGFRLRTLLDEMIQQEDLRFLAVVRPNGLLEAFSESTDGVGLDRAALAALPAQDDPAWVVVQRESGPLFVVFRVYRPLRRPQFNEHSFAQVPFMPLDRKVPPPQPKKRPAKRPAQQVKPMLVAVGLDAAPYLRAARKDVMTVAVTCALGLALVAMAGLSFFWRRKVAALEGRKVRAERLAALGTLAAGVAHEIRNPLSSIKGFATYFGEKFAPGSPDRELAQVMVGEAERLNRVVSELLELTRPFELRLEPRNPSELLRHALMLVEGDCRAGGIDVEAETGSEDLVPLDADRMRQALLNVLLNAIQAMPAGGTLGASVVRVRDRLEFHVRDTGPGIRAEDAARIFDPYFTTRGKGTGLGLPLVQKIIEAHGGRVRVVSEPGVGTEIILEIPVTGDGR